MIDPVLPLEGVAYPHLAPKVGPEDHGVGRRCAFCGAKVNRYTQPQPVTGAPLCNLHWHLPAGYHLTPTGRVSLARVAA